MSKKKTKIPFSLRFIRWAFPKVEAVAPKLAANWAWKLFFTPFRFKPPVVEEKFAQKARQSVLNVGQQTIQVYEWGEGEEAVLVLHGWSGRATQFRKIVEEFNNRGIKVVGIDGPAHGRSTGKRTHIIEFAEVLIAVKEKYPKIESMVTHSFGGASALMAIRKGLQIKNLVDIGTPTDADYIISDFLRRINGKPKSGERFRERVVAEFNNPFSFYSVKESVKHIKDINLLLIHDKNDKEVPVQHAIDLNREYPKAKLIVTEGLGHMRILKDPEVINTCIQFIDETQNIVLA